jgi:hypothetical protein
LLERFALHSRTHGLTIMPSFTPIKSQGSDASESAKSDDIAQKVLIRSLVFE